MFLTISVQNKNFPNMSYSRFFCPKQAKVDFGDFRFIYGMPSYIYAMCYVSTLWEKMTIDSNQEVRNLKYVLLLISLKCLF